MYYFLFESEAAAREAAARWTASVRKDWDTAESEVPAVRPGFLLPIHRCSKAAGADRSSLAVRETVKGLEKLGHNILQWDGRPLAGFEVEASGPFARANEPYAGEATAYFWAAWPVGS